MPAKNTELPGACAYYPIGIFNSLVLIVNICFSLTRPFSDILYGVLCFGVGLLTEICELMLTSNFSLILVGATLSRTVQLNNLVHGQGWPCKVETCFDNKNK